MTPLLHLLTNKYQPHTVCYPNDKWSSCCQQMTVCCSKDLKKKIYVCCQELCRYLMWNDTYMTAKPEHNCSVNNEEKCSERLHCTAFFFLFFYFSLRSPSKYLSATADIVLCHFFQFGLCVFCQDGWTMCFWGKTKMWPIKACQGTEAGVKWCANALLSLRWHYKWLPMGTLIIQNGEKGVG